MAFGCVIVIFEKISSYLSDFSLMAHYLGSIHHILTVSDDLLCCVSINQGSTAYLGGLFQIFENFGEGDIEDWFFEFDQGVVMAYEVNRHPVLFN